MKELRAALALLLLALPRVPAMELAEILQRAADHDAQVRVLRAGLENALIAARRADLDPAFAVSLTSGRARLSRSTEPRYGDPVDSLSLSPALTIQLASPLGTEVSVSVPSTYDLRAGTAYRTSPTVTVTQPLNDLLGIERDAVADLELRRAVESARVALARRVQAVEKDVLTRLRDLWAGESTLGDLAVQIQAARRDLDQAAALGTYAPGTAALARLEQTLRGLERRSELQAAKQARDLGGLQRVVGGPVDGLPAQVAGPALVLPAEDAAADSADVGLAALALRLEELRLREQLDGKRPALSVTGSYSRTTTERLGQEITNSEAMVGVELAFDHLTVTAGPGAVEETGTLYFGAEVTWSPPARRLDDLDREKQRNEVAARRAEVEAAERSYLETRAELESRVLDLRLQAEDLALSRSVAELELAETAGRHRDGLADDQELAEARWAVDKVAFDEKLLAVDRLTARVDLEALTMRREEM